MKNSIYLSVIIPAFNEAENYKRGVLNQVKNYLNKQKYSWEVILVNDGSKDKTLDLLKTFSKENPKFRVVDIPHGGKVAAVKAGVFESRGEIVLFTDFDQSTPIDEVEGMIKHFEGGADLVIAQRNQTEGWAFSQKLRSKIFNLLVQLVALPGIGDTQCGFKAFKNNVANQLFKNLQVTQKTQKGGYMGAFDVELLFLARKYKLITKSIEVPWKYFESTRLSSSEPFKMLRDVTQVRLFDLTSKYDYEKNKAGGFKLGLKFNLLPMLIIFIFAIPSFADTLRGGYFPMHDDLQVMRHLIMDKCFADGQIPCRWSQDLGFGYGYPIFNYYPPLPYYFGQIFIWLGVTIIDTVKILVVLNLLLSGIFMYFLTKEFWGKLGGIISGIFYIYAPYHAVDIYVRGAINEAWALVWFPAVFLFIYKLIVNQKWIYILPLSLSVSFLLLSHNPMLMIFVPAAIVWTIFWLISTKNIRSLIPLTVAGILGLGLAAFFTIPVIMEQKYAHVETLVMGYFNYLAHFANLNQLFLNNFWGFGASELGIKDGMSFQVGYLHWILSISSLISAAVIFKKHSKISLMIILMFGLSTFYTFMVHERSSFIWTIVKPLEYLQFPWRFLSLSIFGTSFLAGSVVFLLSRFLKGKIRAFLVLSLLIATVTLYQGYFRWREYYPDMTDEKKFSGKEWQLLITAGIFDYLPIWAPRPPASGAVTDADIIEGSGKVETISKNSMLQEYNVNMEEPGIVQINTYYFPGWEYSINDQNIGEPQKDKELGRPLLNLESGNHRVMATFNETPLRRVSNLFTLVSWVTFIFLAFYFIKSKNATKNS